MDAKDIALLLGLSLLATGLYMAWPPLAFIAGGAALVYVATK